MTTEPILRPRHINALRGAVCFLLAGESDGVSESSRISENDAFVAMQRVSRQTCWLPFSRKELELLWLVIGNGAPEHGNSLGMTTKEKSTFFQAANRIADAGGFLGDRF